MAREAGPAPQGLDRPLVSCAPIPFDRAAQPLLERRARAKSKIALRTGGVERTARLSVGFRRVPDDLAGEPGQPGDQLHQIPDRDLEAGAEVHRFVALVTFAS